MSAGMSVAHLYLESGKIPNGCLGWWLYLWKKKRKRKMRCLSSLKGLQPIFLDHYICLIFPCNLPGVNFRNTIGSHKIQLDFYSYEKTISQWRTDRQNQINRQNSQRYCREAGSQTVLTCVLIFVEGFLMNSLCAIRILRCWRRKMSPTPLCRWAFAVVRGLQKIHLKHVQFKYINMQHKASAVTKGLKSVADCTVSNFCSYMYIVLNMKCFSGLIHLFGLTNFT